MKLISQVRIEGFRSLREVTLEGLGDFSVLAGLNNSGKSNVLRALNAFFNDEVEPGIPLRVSEDYYRPDRQKKKKKRISVAVKFELPTEFRFRTGLEQAEQLLGRRFELRKEWTWDEILPSFSVNGTEVAPANRERILQFLQLISFRYIPNRVLPIAIIEKEHRALRDVLIKRLGKKLKETEKIFDSISEVGQSLITLLSKRIEAASPGVGQVQLATPRSWADIAFAFGYRLGGVDCQVEDAAQGSGVQSLLMLETLYLVDQDYFQKFGWKQAAIWAVEEPESSLHANLEAHVAAYLADVSGRSGSRLQVMATTHSDLMIQYASPVFLIEKASLESKTSRYPGPREAIDRLSKLGVSRWVHPLLHHPLDPVIIVEGKFDAVFFREALRFIRVNRTPTITYLEELVQADGVTGGDSNTIDYVKAHRATIKSRNSAAKVVLVLDWDSASKLNGVKTKFDAADPFDAVAWDPAAANPKLNKHFRGYERFLSERVIEQAITDGVQIQRFENQAGYHVDQAHWDRAKPVISGIVQRSLQETDLAIARPFLEAVLRTAGCIQ